MELISTTRGGKKLLLDGYAYIVDKTKENIKYWRCERRGSCSGRVKMENDVVLGEASSHSHPPDAGHNLALKTVQKIKERAQQSEVTSTILQNCTCDYPLNAAGALPKKETLARMVRRQRSATHGDKLTNDLRKTIRGEDFVIHQPEDLVILTTNRSLQLLSHRQECTGGEYQQIPGCDSDVALTTQLQEKGQPASFMHVSTSSDAVTDMQASTSFYSRKATAAINMKPETCVELLNKPPSSKTVIDDLCGGRMQNNEVLSTGLMANSSSFSSAPCFKDLNEDFMLWLAMDMEPFSMAKNNGLNYFFRKNFPYLSIPHESSLWRNYAMAVYNELASTVKRDLSSVASVGLMFHGWTDKSSGIYYVGLRAQFILEDWTGRVVTLSVKPCDQDNYSITEHLRSEICSFIPQLAGKELYATHDGTDAMIKASEALQVKSWSFGIEHGLQHLLTSDSLRRVSNVVSVLIKCKSMVKTLYNKLNILEACEQRDVCGPTTISHEFTDLIIELKRLLDAEICYFTKEDDVANVETENRNLLADGENIQYVDFTGVGQSEKISSWIESDVSINWISSLHVIKALLNFQCEVTFAFRIIGKMEECLQPHEWILVEELNRFLGTFLALSELINTRTTSLSLVPLIRAEIADSCNEDSGDCKDLTEVKNLILKNLDKRFPVTSSTELATLLDPAAKGLCNLNGKEKIDILYNAITEISKSGSALDNLVINVTIKTEDDLDLDSRSSTADSISSTAETFGPISKKMKLIQKHTGASVTPQCKQREEIKKYIEYNADDFEDDPLAFWKKGQFPLLAGLARSILTQSASSSMAESIFSTAEILLNARRSNLPPSRVNCLSFIRDNYLMYSGKT